MKLVSSVMAFVVRQLSDPDLTAEACDLLDTLRPIERRLLALLACVPQCEDRRRRLAEETAETWDPARYDRVESLALLHLQRALQAQVILPAVVKRAGDIPVRESFGGNKVLHANFRRVHLEFASDDIHQALENIRRVGLADAAQ